jgi:hypothetical protein
VLVACGSQGTGADPAEQVPLQTLDGKAVSLDDYAGKPVFLAFMEST